MCRKLHRDRKVISLVKKKTIISLLSAESAQSMVKVCIFKKIMCIQENNVYSRKLCVFKNQLCIQ